MIFDPPLHRIFIIKLLYRSYREEEGAVLKPRRDINDSIIGGESIVPLPARHRQIFGIGKKKKI